MTATKLPRLPKDSPAEGEKREEAAEAILKRLEAQLTLEFGARGALVSKACCRRSEIDPFGRSEIDPPHGL